MKTITLLLVLGLLGATTVARGFDFGVRVGWNNAKINVKDLQMKSHGGFMAGAFARFDLASLYLEPALEFSRKKCEASKSPVKEILGYSSVDIPLMLGLYIINAKFIKIRGFVGPEVSILTNKLTLDKIESDLQSHRAIWNGRAGAGVDAGNFCLDLNYGFALKDIGGDAKKARSFTLTLGFKIL
ncbi:MAG: PorT family protein [Odoribacteraceae bacterium]|jgi:hypothetical protein|nr:PorT family protein [Odoribacteraceae bacterium]